MNEKEAVLITALQKILELAKDVSFKPEDKFSLNGPVCALGRIQGRAEYVLSLYESEIISQEKEQ